MPLVAGAVLWGRADNRATMALTVLPSCRASGRYGSTPWLATRGLARRGHETRQD